MQESRQNYLSLEKVQHEDLGMIQSLKSLESTSILQANEQNTCPSVSVYQKSFIQQSQKLSKQNINWSPEEDQYLQERVQNKFKKGQKVSWKSLSSQLNSQFHSGESVRDRLKTRQRYYNCLDPNLKKGNWTEAEDQFIVLKKSQGLQWCKIKSYIQGRNDHQVKNRFYFLLKQFSKNNSYCVKIFTSQLQIIDFNHYISTYLQNEKNDKLKQIMKSLAKRKSQPKQESEQTNIQVEVPPQIVTYENKSAFVAYNSEYKRQISLRFQEKQQELAQISNVQIIPSQGLDSNQLAGYQQFCQAMAQNNQKQNLILNCPEINWNQSLC